MEHLHLVGQLHLAQPEEVIMMSMRMIMMMQEKNLVKSDCEEENRFGLLTMLSLKNEPLVKQIDFLQEK